MFIDFNQNAPHKTVFGAWSRAGPPDGQVSTPLAWDELDDIHPDDLTIATVPERLRRRGDPWADMDDRPQSLEPLLAMSERDRAAGLHGRAVAAGVPEDARRAAAGGAQPGQGPPGVNHVVMRSSSRTLYHPCGYSCSHDGSGG